MSDCDVCIGGDCGEYPDFYSRTTVTSRKDRKCYECGRVIPPGEPYERVAMKYEGAIDVLSTCSVCAEIAIVFSCGEGRMHGVLWEYMEELAFERLTTASPCFTKLSVAAKQRVLDEWRRWKGIAA